MDNMDNMHILIYELHTLSQYNFKSSKYLSEYTSSNKFLETFIKYKINKISSLLDKLLVSNIGKINWENYYILADKKYCPFPIEQDSFGWLIGGIETSKGIITFG